MKIPWSKMNKKCDLKTRCVYLCKEDSHHENEELNMVLKNFKLPEFRYLGTA